MRTNDKLLSRATAIAIAVVLAITGISGVPATAAEPTGLRVMSFNLWHAGSQVNDGQAKQIRFVSEHADLIGVQESGGTAAQDIAAALGWDHAQSGGSVGIVSRYPIIETYGPIGKGMGARVRIDADSEAVIWTVHLNYTPYGPYDACFGGMSGEELGRRELASHRPQELARVLHAMQAQLADADTTPVFLTGDFNAPSHLDWVPEAASLHCGYESVSWPTSIATRDAGMRDSYRIAHPDPVADPANTWSPIFPTFTGGYGYDDHIGEPEPPDRIDFVHFAGNLDVVGSDRLVVGDPAPYPDHKGNEWASDHAAVVTAFEFPAETQ